MNHMTKMAEIPGDTEFFGGTDCRETTAAIMKSSRIIERKQSLYNKTAYRNIVCPESIKMWKKYILWTIDIINPPGNMWRHNLIDTGTS